MFTANPGTPCVDDETPRAKNYKGRMDLLEKILVFTLAERRYAVRLDIVERVVRTVEINPVPKAPDSVLGLINLRGQLVPMLNIRKFFCLPEREPDLNDRMLIVRAKERTVAFPADEVGGVLECPKSAMVAGGAVLPEVKYLEGVMALKDGMVLIYDLDRFLSSEGGAVFDHHAAPGDEPASTEGEREGTHD